MPTTVTSTIKSTGGDYSSIGAWETGTDNNLVSLDQVQIGDVYIHGTTGYWPIAADTTFGGSTVDSTRYRNLRGAQTEFTGVVSTGPRIRLGNGSIEFAVTEQYFRFTYLELYGDTTHDDDGLQIDVDNWLVSHCLFHDLGGDVFEIALEVYGTGKVQSTVFWSIAAAAVALDSASDTVSVWQCTAYSCCDEAGTGMFTFHCENGTMNAVNCCAFNAVNGQHYGGGGTLNLDDCAASDAEGDPASLDNLTATDQFTDPAGHDFSILDTGADIYHAGDPITGGPSTDLVGTTWHATTPSVGAFELEAAAPAGPRLLMLTGVGT